MEKAKHTGSGLPAARDPERVVGEYYGQLKKWAAILTRGDLGMAEEIVHDLCLHFTLVKPDLSKVANLDGYLYICLRHIYLSTLARSSREAVQTVSIADFDSIRFALGASSADSLLERQNELRRICNYAVWRKDSSKSASCFILHFFHDYTRRQVADIACLPIAAIYNKLKTARSDLSSHLESSGKLRIAVREAAPKPILAVSAVSSAELFSELKLSILAAKHSECLSENILLGQYRAAIPKPIPCDLLSHIVSCGRCLALVDRYFDEHRGEPLASEWSSKDGVDVSSDVHDDSGHMATMRLVKQKRDRVYQHRPRTLSIAVNGRITALHDVQAERSTLASRIDQPESVQFVEVFTDQQIRLALVPVIQLPPNGLHVHTQQVSLSDGRWLELKVSFDGLGLHSEVTYLDPALAAGMAQQDADEDFVREQIPQEPPLLPVAVIGERAHSPIARIARTIFGMKPQYGLAWTMGLAILLASAGYLAHRRTREPLNASALLDEAVRMETSELKDETEHRILRLDAISANGHAVWQGTVDVWQEPMTGRSVRRLYDAQNKLVAVQWRGKHGESGSPGAPGKESLSPADQEVAASSLWEQDVSAHAFQELNARQMRVSLVGTSYELTGTGISNGPLHLVSATLLLDHGRHFAGETLHTSAGYGVTEIRFVQAREEREPSGSVPDSVFEPVDLNAPKQQNAQPASLARQVGTDSVGVNERLVQTQISVLYRLSELGADVAEPIEINRTRDGHIRVTGTLESVSRKKQIITALENLPDRQLLELQLASQSDLRIPIPATRATEESVTSVYDVAQTGAPADSLLREYYAAKALNDGQTNLAIAQFSRDALERAQQSLQDAYALDRLGRSFTADELRTMGPMSQQQWAEMVHEHASSLHARLRELHDQLAPLVPANKEARDSVAADTIGTPANFAQEARELLRQTQDLHRAVGKAFSSGPAYREAQSPDSLIAAAMDAIPLEGTERITAFALRLTAPADSANRDDKRAPRQPR